MIAAMLQQQKLSKAAHARPGAGFVPAHDLMGEEDAAHLWILVLAFVQDGLEAQAGKRLLRTYYAPITRLVRAYYALVSLLGQLLHSEPKLSPVWSWSRSAGRKGPAPS